jgi:hypothetical protein
MISVRQLASSLYGVWLLLRWDPAGFLNLVVLCAFMSYAAFLAHHGLDVPWLTSAGVVTLDIVLSLVVRQVVGLV